MALGKGAVSPAIAATVISLAVGGAGGYFARYFQEPTVAPPAPPGAQGGVAGGGGGGPRRPQETNGGRLAKQVYNVAVLQAVQNKALTPAQSEQLLPMLNKFKTESLDEVKAGYATGEIIKVLTPAQRDAIEFMQTTSGASMRVQDPARPFESENAKEGIGSLLSSLTGRQASQ